MSARNVALLLLSSRDWLPSIRVSTGLLGSLPGPSASSYVPCDRCGGCGRVVADVPCQVCRTRKVVRPRHGCRRCLVCDGTGERRRRPSDPAVDRYVGKQMDELEREVVDARVPHKGFAMVEEPDPVMGDYIWVRDGQRYRSYGDYDKVFVELEWLRDRFPGRSTQLARWIEAGGTRDGMGVDHPFMRFSPSAELEVWVTLGLIANRTGKLRVPGWVRRTYLPRLREPDMVRSSPFGG